MTVAEIKKRIIPVLKRHGIKKAGLFGSVARGEESVDSDVDVLVEIDQRGFSLFDFVGVKLELEEALKKKVDLVEYSSIKPLLRKNILASEVKIL